MMEARGLTLLRGGKPVVAGLSLRLRPGEVLAVLGPNGAGKSSLLSLLSGACVPDAGRIRLDERPLADWPIAALAQRRAVLPQSTEAAFNLSAWDVVALGRTPHHGRNHRAHDEAIIAGALAATGVGHLSERDCATLSGGEQQRVQLARCLAQIWEPPDQAAGQAPATRLLFLDEPVASLDPAQQHAVLALARRVAACGVSVFVVLHDLNLASTYADRCLIMARGQAVAEGEPAEVLTPDILERVYGHPFQVIPRQDLRRPLVLARPLGASGLPGVAL